MLGPDPDGEGAPARAATSPSAKLHGGRADEARHEAVGGAAVEVQRRADLLDHPGPQHHDLVGQRHGLDLVMRDIDHGGAELPVQLGDLEPRADAQRGVEVRQGFVEQEQPRLAHDRAADGDALALPAR